MALIKCADLNRYTFSLLNIKEKVYLFKSAHLFIDNQPTRGVKGIWTDVTEDILLQFILNYLSKG